MPELSILLPVRNGERYLDLALRSTLSAMPKDAELLVIDDDSTDGTAAIAEARAAADRRVRVLHRTAATGLPDALNDGIARTDSRYLARMDADDVCLPTRFARQLRSLRRVDFVFGSSVLIDERGRPTGISSPLPVRPRAARLHLLVGNFFSHPTMACRREPLVSLGGYAASVVEDFELWLRAAAAGNRMLLSPLPAIAYRRHASQVTSSWRLTAEEPLLDAGYGRLVPEALRDVVPVLRHSAVTRSRTTQAERAAWARLVAELSTEGRRLPLLDRAALALRVRGQDPGAAS